MVEHKEEATIPESLAERLESFKGPRWITFREIAEELGVPWSMETDAVISPREKEAEKAFYKAYGPVARDAREILGQEPERELFAGHVEVNKYTYTTPSEHGPEYHTVIERAGFLVGPDGLGFLRLEDSAKKSPVSTAWKLQEAKYKLRETLNRQGLKMSVGDEVDGDFLIEIKAK